MRSRSSLRAVVNTARHSSRSFCLSHGAAFEQPSIPGCVQGHALKEDAGWQALVRVREPHNVQESRCLRADLSSKRKSEVE